MPIQQLSVEEALNSVGSSPQGLSCAETRRRLREYGPNRIEKIAQWHPELRLLALRAVQDPFALTPIQTLFVDINPTRRACACRRDCRTSDCYTCRSRYCPTAFSA
jgi:hypothetical protein